MLGKSVSCTSGQEQVGRTQFRPVGRMVVDMFSPRRCWSSPRLQKFLLLVQKIRWRIIIASTACFVGETCPWDLGDYMNWSATSNGSIIWGHIRDFVPGTILLRYVAQMGGRCMGPNWKLRRSCSCIWMCLSWNTNVRFTMILLKGSPLPLRQRVHALGSNWVVVIFSARRRLIVDVGGVLDPGGSVDGSFCEHRWLQLELEPHFCTYMSRFYYGHNCVIVQ